MKNTKLIKWKIHTHNKTISYDKHTFLDKIKGLFGFPKFTVNEFYSYLEDEFTKPDKISFDVPMDTEGWKNSSILYPRYWLTNSWTINNKDLKHLIKGPLISEDRKNTLVDKTPFLKSTKEIAKAILYLMGGVLTIYGFIKLIFIVF